MEEDFGRDLVKTFNGVNGISSPGTDTVLSDTHKDTINLFRSFETTVGNLKKMYDNKLRADQLVLEIKSKKDFEKEGLTGEALTKALQENHEKRKELLHLKKQPNTASDKESYLKELDQILFRLDLRTSSVKSKVNSTNYVGTKSNKITYSDVLDMIVYAICRDHNMMYDGKSRKFKSCYISVYECPKEVFGKEPQQKSEEKYNIPTKPVKSYSREAFLKRLENIVAYKDVKIVEKLKKSLQDQKQENSL